MNIQDQSVKLTFWQRNKQVILIAALCGFSVGIYAPLATVLVPALFYWVTVTVVCTVFTFARIGSATKVAVKMIGSGELHRGGNLNTVTVKMQGAQILSGPVRFAIGIAIAVLAIALGIEKFAAVVATYLFLAGLVTLPILWLRMRGHLNSLRAQTGALRAVAVTTSASSDVSD